MGARQPDQEGAAVAMPESPPTAELDKLQPMEEGTDQRLDELAEIIVEFYLEWKQR